MRTYEVNVKGRDWATTITAPTAGKAKYQFLLSVRESWDTVSFKDLTCRAARGPNRDPYKWVRDNYNVNPRVGDRITYGGKLGEIILLGTASTAQYVAVWLDGASNWMVCHPTDPDLIYTEAPCA